MASRCRRYRPRRLQALKDNPELLVIRPSPPSASLNDLQPFNLSTVLMAVHKHCYTSLKRIQQGGPRRRETSDMAMEMVLRRMKIEGATVHGFRSAFRDWAAECTNFTNEVCEAALAHVIQNKVEAAYPSHSRPATNRFRSPSPGQRAWPRRPPHIRWRSRPPEHCRCP
jgi:integrase